MGASNWFVIFCLTILVLPVGKMRLGGTPLNVEPNNAEAAKAAMAAILFHWGFHP